MQKKLGLSPLSGVAEPLPSVLLDWSAASLQLVVLLLRRSQKLFDR
jgi:hypothetical protein